jgi:hypothetical protein
MRILDSGVPGGDVRSPHEAFDCQPCPHAGYFDDRSRSMTEKEYEALYEALEAAHKILPGEKDCGTEDFELRKKIRKLEKAVLKRQKEAARAERKEKQK